MADEDRSDRLNRELDQLLGELRVALPGVQVLFAFLLTVPFTQRYDRLGDTAKDVYFGAFVFAALASIQLIAPTVHHRLRFRDGIKEEMILTANRLALGGAACLGISMGATLYVTAEMAFGASPARYVGPAITLLAALIWFVVPLRYRTNRRRGADRSVQGADDRASLGAAQGGG
ncbi:MAG: hypothetical protein JWN46_3966 [Acidimicrobiales bacterium]|nr:hypothetical protein [Acidimicrobiales bacterium]